MGILNQDLWSSQGVVAGFVGLLTVIIILARISATRVHPNEPKVIHPWVPFIGHLLGMAVYGGKYVKRLGLSHPGLPIFTLPVPRSRIYVVADPALAAAVQRASKVLSFSPLVPDITEHIFGLDKRTVAILKRNLDPGPGEEPGFLSDLHDMLYSYLGPGQPLNELTCIGAEELGRLLSAYAESLLKNGKASEVVDLLPWVRHFVASGTGMFLYGPNNPIAVDPRLEKSFWDLDHGLGRLMIGLFPALTAAKAYKGREAIITGLERYLREGHVKEASSIVQKRVKIAEKYEFTESMTARSELAMLYAGIVNTATTIFWMVLRIFADKQLLAAVRAEVEIIISESAEEVAGEDDVISVEAVKENCPTLMAVFRECLRVGSENFSIRLVKNDMMLADKYFLKKDSVVQIAGGIIHADKSIWGGDAETFNAQRFLKEKDGKQLTPHPAAFRAFGGGKTMCPGRQFATNEILVFALMIVADWDIEAPDGGLITVPEKDDGIMPVHILEPHEKDVVRVVVRPRESSAKRKWKVVI